MPLLLSDYFNTREDDKMIGAKICKIYLATCLSRHWFKSLQALSSECNSGADPENSERGGRDPHPLPPE